MNEVKCSEAYSTAKNVIRVCIKDTKQNFIYIGHYLKEIRDNRLYQEDGYADFDKFMAGEIGKDKSWASRCINVASQFGIVENGQPVLSEQYQDYSLSLLIEMVAMTPEQRELVTPDTEVKAAREIKKTGKEKSCESQLPEPAEEKDTALDMDGSCPPGQSGCRRQEWGFEAEQQAAGKKECARCWADWKKTREVLEQEEEQSEQEEQKPFQRGCITGKSRYGTCSCCGSDGVRCCGQCENSCNSRCGWLDDPWEGEPELPSSTKPEKSEWVNQEEEQVDESYSFAGVKRASDRWNLTLARKFVRDRFRQLISGHTVIPDNDKIIEQFKRYSQLNSDAIAVDAGVEAYAASEMVEYDRGYEDLGICLYERFSNIVRKQLDEYIQEQAAAEQEQPDEKEPEQETVIDAEFTEVPPSEEYTPEYFLAEHQRSLNEILKACEGEAPAKVPRKLLARQKIIVAALTAMVSSLEPPDEPDPVVQPELPVMKNNDQRAAFVDAYETWPLWIETRETGERYYRYDLPDETGMVVKVYFHRIFDRSINAKKWDDNYKDGWGTEEYYLLKDGKFFKDCLTNRSLLIEKLKEIQKKGKG